MKKYKLTGLGEARAKSKNPILQKGSRRVDLQKATDEELEFLYGKSGKYTGYTSRYVVLATGQKTPTKKPEAST
ncbi:MAG: hypothetical protein AAF655_12065 [Bacteroidota bacterium]